MQALIIVDMQNDFCHPEGARGRRVLIDESEMSAVVEANLRLAAAFRERGWPVLFVATEHGRWSDSVVWRSRPAFREREQVDAGTERPPSCIAGEWGYEFFGDLQPEASDRVVVKHRYSAFLGTDLELILRTLKVQSLIVTGVATNVCVETTIRDAFMRDFDTAIVPEACSANSPAEHQMAIENVSHYFGRVVSLEEALDRLAAGAVA